MRDQNYQRGHQQPAASKLEVTRSIEAESTLETRRRVRGASNGLACERRRLVLLAPDELAARDKRFVDGTLQWLSNDMLRRRRKVA